MRICLVGSKSCPPVIGGIEVFTYEIGRRLAANGAEVTVIVPRAPQLRREEQLEGMRIVRVRAMRNRFSLKASMAPHQILEAARIQPDIFHANDPACGVVGLLRLGWRNCVLTVHGIGFSQTEWPTPFRQGGIRLQKLAVEGSDVVTCTDGVTASMLKNYRDDLRVIPPGVDTLIFSRGRHQRPEAFEHGKLNILHVGRLTKVKGTDILIESLGLLSKDTMDSISLKIIGTGPLSPLVAKAAKLHSSVQWLGEMPHDRIPPYLTNADMLIMPSRSEGVPISMLEAMASMVPVLCTSVGGIGYYFDERHFVKIADTTAEAVAVAVESAVRERTSTVRKAAEAKALIDSQFSWDVVTKQYVESYEEILS